MGMNSYEVLGEEILNKIENGYGMEAYGQLVDLATVKDNSDAMTILGVFYANGIIVTQDFKEAQKWFSKAMALNNPSAYHELGVLYYYGGGPVIVDYVKALELFTKGAELGHPKCLSLVAEIYLKGVTERENPEFTFECALKAAKIGATNYSKFLLAVCYFDGIGTRKDPQSAYHWLKEYLDTGKEANRDVTLVLLARCLVDPYEEFGVHPTTDMLNEAFFYTSKAVEMGNVEAHILACWFYEKGEVVPKDFDLAYKYLKIAADNGNEFAKEHMKLFRKSIFGHYYMVD